MEQKKRIKVIKEDTGHILEGVYVPNSLETNWMKIQVDIIDGKPYKYDNPAYEWHNIDKNKCSLIEFL